jgi:hypothetical protein
MAGFQTIREATDADLKFLDPFNEPTRRGLGMKP